MMKVANLVFNSFVNDSRVLKISNTLSLNNYSIEVIAHLDKDLLEKEKLNHFIIKRFSYLDREETKNKIFKLNKYLKYIIKSINYCKSFNIIHCNDLSTLPIGVILKKFYNKNIKIVYDAHEHETETIALKGISKRIAKLLERVLIRYADKVITVSGAIADDYVKMYNIERPALVLNTPNYKRIEKKNIFREKLGIRVDQTIVLYQGALSKGRGIETLLEVFKNMKEEKSVVVFMGYGILEDLIKKVSSEYKNIYFHSAVSPDVLLDYTCSSDFGISTIEDICLSYRYCLPNKMFEYLMAEVPVIISNLPEMRKLVEKNKVGVISKENTIEGLKNAILEAEKLDKNDLHANILKVKEVYNWEEQEKVLLNLYNELS